MCKHGFHFIHEMHYSSIAYFQGEMTGGVKSEIGFSWMQELTLCIPCFRIKCSIAFKQLPMW
ncbi:hypothetical protein CPA52_13080 [Pseudoalteromonas marina]|nr:hypothetical protein CPA52_13080 [Pseudoalteromonas marina]